jgi:hypothetical protein
MPTGLQLHPDYRPVLVHATPLALDTQDLPADLEREDITPVLCDRPQDGNAELGRRSRDRCLGDPFSVMAFTVRGRNIVAIDALADPARLRGTRPDGARPLRASVRG